MRRAPVTWLPLNDDHLPDGDHPWAVAHPVLCAVRLAADPARGREIVEDWGIVPGHRRDGERRRHVTPVLLSGRHGGTTHREVELLASLPPELRLIGGLAVMCRVGSPHRTTVDLDAVARDLDRTARVDRPHGRHRHRAVASTASRGRSTWT